MCWMFLSSSCGRSFFFWLQWLKPIQFLRFQCEMIGAGGVRTFKSQVAKIVALRFRGWVALLLRE